MSDPQEDVYCTLLLNDRYLPGAQVLAHSLRDAGTTKKLAVMVTLEGVTKNAIAELKKVYDYVIPVDPVHTVEHTNLHLMNRPDLSAALTKIAVWKQTQFRKIVYLDADTVALRAPDELFDTESDFAAAPDVGWPDCFNSGVMVLTPNVNTHASLEQKASEGATFDGADQGLLNQHFPEYKRLSFTYNCTIGTDLAYQYAPAFKHYGDNVSMAHFIGDNKPWQKGPSGASGSAAPYDKLSGHWWGVWNKHYGSSFGTSFSSGSSQEIAGESGSGSPFDYVSQLQGGEAAAEGGEAAAKGGASAGENESLGGSSGETQRLPSTDVSKLAQDIAQAQQLQETITPVQDVQKLFGGHQPPIGAGHSAVESAVESPAPAKKQAPAVPLTHREQHIVHKKHHATVATPEGVVPQEQFFQTGARSYYIQRYDANGIAIPREPGTIRPSAAKDVLQKLNAKMQDAKDMSHTLQREQVPSASAMDHPAIAPPKAKHAEARPSTKKDSNLDHKTSGRNFVNEWDKPQGPSKPKTVFPWEGTSRKVGRVFPGDPVPTARRSYGSDASDGETVDNQSAEQSDADSDNEDLAPSYGSYSLQNKWDSDPKIQTYVRGLKLTKNRSDGVTRVISPGGALSAPPSPPTATAPAPPSRQEAWHTNDQAQTAWNPEQKLEELRQLPRSFIASQMANSNKSAAIQTDEDEEQTQLPRVRNAV